MSQICLTHTPTILCCCPNPSVFPEARRFSLSTTSAPSPTAVYSPFSQRSFGNGNWVLRRSRVRAESAEPDADTNKLPTQVSGENVESSSNGGGGGSASTSLLSFLCPLLKLFSVSLFNFFFFFSAMLFFFFFLLNCSVILLNRCEKRILTCTEACVRVCLFLYICIVICWAKFICIGKELRITKANPQRRRQWFQTYLSHWCCERSL